MRQHFHHHVEHALTLCLLPATAVLFHLQVEPARLGVYGVQVFTLYDHWGIFPCGGSHDKSS
jgi:hypothetical protein